MIDYILDDIVYIIGVYKDADAKLQFSTADIPGKCFGSL
jgi:hypothetical protein